MSPSNAAGLSHLIGAQQSHVSQYLEPLHTHISAALPHLSGTQQASQREVQLQQAGELRSSASPVAGNSNTSSPMSSNSSTTVASNTVQPTLGRQGMGDDSATLNQKYGAGARGAANS